MNFNENNRKEKITSLIIGSIVFIVFIALIQFTEMYKLHDDPGVLKGILMMCFVFYLSSRGGTKKVVFNLKSYISMFVLISVILIGISQVKTSYIFKNKKEIERAEAEATVSEEELSSRETKIQDVIARDAKRKKAIDKFSVECKFDKKCINKRLRIEGFDN